MNSSFPTDADTGDPPVYGFQLDPADTRLLRSRPPAAALAWVADAVGRGSRTQSVQALPGGMSSAVHLVTVADAADRCHRLVLRRYVRDDWLAEEPDLAEREAEVLRVVAASEVPAPQLVAVDPTGTDAGVPAVLMTALPGHLDWATAERGTAALDAWLTRLADVLPAIHATGVPDSADIRPYRPYELGKELAPPPWTRHPRAWERAIDVYNGPPPVVERFFIHRDYHPGNVLWSGGRITGIVDWANASLGSPEADVGHCRVNLVGHLGPDVADRFLAAYQAVSGRDTYHPYWDIAVVVAPADSYGEPDPVFDDWMASVVAQLG